MATERKIVCRLHRLMGEHKIKSIRQLSEDTGLSRQTLTKMYNDKTQQVDLQVAVKLCNYFNVPFDELYEMIEVEEDEK